MTTGMEVENKESTAAENSGGKAPAGVEVPISKGARPWKKPRSYPYVNRAFFALSEGLWRNERSNWGMRFISTSCM